LTAEDDNVDQLDVRKWTHFTLWSCRL